jgi:PAS domain S-box-containing protein
MEQPNADITKLDLRRAQEVLEATNDRLVAMFEGARDAIFLADPETGTILDANGEATRLLNRAKEEIIGLHQAQLHPPEESDAYRLIFQEQLQDPQTTLVQAEVVTSDGRRIPVEISASRIRLRTGRTLIQGIFRDVSRRERTEDQLRQLSRAVEQSPASIVITNLRGEIEFVSKKFTQITGYTPEEALGVNPRLLQSGHTPAATYRELWNTITSGDEWRGEFLNRKKNGELFWETAVISPVRDAEGRITHYLAVKEDVTAHRRAKERILEQAALLDQTQDAILVLNAERRIAYANQAAANLYHRSSALLVGQLGDKVLFPDEPQRCAEVCQLTSERGSWSGEIRVGQFKPQYIQSRWTRVPRPAGSTSFLITNTDVTERRLLEQRVLRSQRMESLGTLAGGVAHDLNNVLAPILMSLEFLRPLAATGGNKQVEEILEMLHASAQRGADIVRQLLIFGRGVEGQRAELQPRTLLKEITKLVKGTFPKDIRLQTVFPEELWTVHGDPTQIHQMLLNLCVNARDAMPQGGDLTITAANQMLDETDAAQSPEARPGSYVVIGVADTGMGIPADLLDRIFEPFFTTKDAGKGTGLGLSTVLGIAKSHGGFLRVESRVATGSHFRLYLPALNCDSMLQSSAPKESLPGGNGELILLVDDEEVVRKVGQKMLETCGYRVLTASNGAEGIVQFSKQQDDIDAVVTDIHMPVMDGAAMIAVLRRLSPGVPIIATSGLPGKDRPIPTDCTRETFIDKPFQAEQLLDALRKALARASNCAIS